MFENIMLPLIYSVLTILTFAILCTGIYYGSFARKIEPRITGVAISFVLISAILSTILAFNSMSITETFCENHISSTNTTGNLTEYTNDLSCVTQRHSEQGLSALFTGMIFFEMFLLLYYAFYQVRV